MKHPNLKVLRIVKAAHKVARKSAKAVTKALN
jgi:hypothetical protein